MERIGRILAATLYAAIAGVSALHACDIVAKIDKIETARDYPPRVEG